MLPPFAPPHLSDDRADRLGEAYDEVIGKAPRHASTILTTDAYEGAGVLLLELRVRIKGVDEDPSLLGGGLLGELDFEDHGTLRWGQAYPCVVVR